MAFNQNCHIIAITGGKGGVGKSVFAANFAQALMMELRTGVLLIDLDTQSCGDQNVILGLRPNKTISEVATFGGQFTPSTVGTLVAQHASGLHFIGAVRNAGESYDVSIEGLKKALEGLSHLYGFIIVDVGSQFLNPQLAVLESATCALMLTLPEILAINQTHKLINQMMTMMFPSEMVQLILNKVGPASPLSPQAAAQALRRSFVGMIPQDDATTGGALARSTPFVATQPRTQISISYIETARRLSQAGVLQKLRQLNKPKNLKSNEAQINQAKSLGGLSATQSRPNDVVKHESFDPIIAMKLRLHKGLIEAMDVEKGLTETKNDPNKENELRMKTQQAIAGLLEKEGGNFGREERAQLVKEVLDEALGLGPLEELLADETVSEVMVNRRDLIFVEQKGRLTRVEARFTSDHQLMRVIERIVTPLGRQINTKSPYVDARLKDGSRVNAIIPPLAIDGPCVTIRKFAKTPITWKNYIEFGTLTQAMIDFLRICIENKLNVIISGGTGSGKTTLLNVLSGFIPVTERIITVEDAAELQLKQEHVIRLETRPPNIEDTGAVTIRDLVRNTLRMRPDRIVVGECRGGEALDMLQAMNTGHDGSLTTVHANNPREAIARLETLCLMAGMELPAKAIREQIASAVDLIIQISRLSDGSRRVTSVTEVIGMQGDTVTLSEIYRFKEEGQDKNRKIIGSFQAGMVPSFLEEFKRKGINVPTTLFTLNPASGPNVTPATPVTSGGGKTGTGGDKT